MNKSVFQEFGATLRQIPPSGLILAALFGVGSAGGEFLTWDAPLDQIRLLAILQILAALAVVYTLCMWLIGQRVSFMGGVRFAVTYIVVLIPTVSAVVLLMFAAAMGQMIIAFAALVLILGALILTALLLAWPVLQATEKRLISPVQVLKATSGYRWSLVGLAFITSAVNRIELDPSPTAGGLKFLLACAGSGLLGCFSLLLFAGAGATAWKFVTRNDPGLVGQ